MSTNKLTAFRRKLRETDIQLSPERILTAARFGFELETQAAIYTDEEGREHNSLSYLRDRLYRVPELGNLIHLGTDQSVAGPEIRTVGGLTYQEFIRVAGVLLEGSNPKLTIDPRCSFHIHVSIPGLIERGAKLPVPQLHNLLQWHLTDEYRNWPLNTKLRAVLPVNRFFHPTTWHPAGRRRVESGEARMRQKYQMINFHPQGTIEFRLFGGVSKLRSAGRCLDLVVVTLSRALTDLRDYRKIPYELREWRDTVNILPTGTLTPAGHLRLMQGTHTPGLRYDASMDNVSLSPDTVDRYDCDRGRYTLRQITDEVIPIVDSYRAAASPAAGDTTTPGGENAVPVGDPFPDLPSAGDEILARQFAEARVAEAATGRTEWMLNNQVISGETWRRFVTENEWAIRNAQAASSDLSPPPTWTDRSAATALTLEEVQRAVDSVWQEGGLVESPAQVWVQYGGDVYMTPTSAGNLVITTRGDQLEPPTTVQVNAGGEPPF